MASYNTATAIQVLKPWFRLWFSQAWSIHAASHQFACLLLQIPAKGIVLDCHFHWAPFSTASEVKLAPHSLAFADTHTAGPFLLNMKLLTCPIVSLLSTVI